MTVSKKVGPKFTDKHEEKIDKIEQSQAIQTALSAVIGQKLDDMSRVMKEIHDKIDLSLLQNAEKFAKLEGKDALYEEKFKQIREDGKDKSYNWWAAATLVATVIAAVLGALLTGK